MRFKNYTESDIICERSQQNAIPLQGDIVAYSSRYHPVSTTTPSHVQRGREMLNESSKTPCHASYSSERDHVSAVAIVATNKIVYTQDTCDTDIKLLFL